MNTLLIRFISLLLFGLLCATLTYWAVVLSRRDEPVTAATAQPPLAADAAKQLFGSAPNNQTTNVQLVGVLAFGTQHAAAIVAVDDQPPRAISLGGVIDRKAGDKQATLAEVRTRSIVINANHAYQEIFLPATVAGPTIYVR